jgi:hypothetical protein
LRLVFGPALFCGRDEATRNLVAQVQKYSFVAVVGPSGSGKSSLVFAGLLPALRRQRETMIWDVVSFRPGGSPLRALAVAFGTVPGNAGPAATDSYLESEAAAYRAGDAGKLSRIVNDRLDAAPEKPDRLLIYVDQWEELYAMAPTTEEAEQRNQHSKDVEKFIALLAAASSGRKSRATVVLTARADFYSFLIRHPLLSTLLPQQQVNVPPLSSRDLRVAIETPANKARLSFAPLALVDQILIDVGTEEGRLPLLQFALKETWERREGDQLTARAYTEVGGVSGAIQKTAERAYAALTPVQQEAARRLFLRLVTPGEGQEDTRARSPIPDDPQQRDIINLFSSPRTRLLVTGYETLQGPTLSAGRDLCATVEVAHEALIRRWATLKAWVDADRQKLRDRMAILRAKAEWEEKGRRDDMLLPAGLQLERARSLLADPGDTSTDDIEKFISLSSAREQTERETREEALARNEARVAHARANVLAQLSEIKLLRGEFDSAFRLASCGARIDLALLSEEVKVSAAATALAVVASLAKWRLGLGHDLVVNSAAFSPDGSRIVTASQDNTARIWDAASGKEIAVLGGHKEPVNSAAFSPDGSRIVTASQDHTARIWDATSAKEIAVLRGPGDHTVESAAFSPDGSRVVTASLDLTARIWDAGSAKEITVLRGHEDFVTSAAFSPDGSRIVTASLDNTARIWDAHLETMSARDLLTEACMRLAGLTKLTREEMRLASYPDGVPEIDVCQ